jgi:acetyl esterase/lipase
MKRVIILIFLSIQFFSVCSQQVLDQPKEITYGRKDGMALTMLVQPPAVTSNGKAIIWVVSAGWTSDFNWIALFKILTKPLSDRGFTLFFVMHGSQPKYAVPDAVIDLKRAVRFIRFHAAEYGIDPGNIGISGASAGGHLSLMIATTGDDGDPSGKDSVDKVSSRVQAVACFFPPVDLLNWKSPGDNAVIRREIKEFQAPLDFVEWNPVTLHYILITDSVKRTEIGRSISPLYFVTSDDPPVLITHGDADKLVPLYQSQKMIEKLKEVNVPCELIIKPGADHGFWNDISVYTTIFADWFDKHLVTKSDKVNNRNACNFKKFNDFENTKLFVQNRTQLREK